MKKQIIALIAATALTVSANVIAAGDAAKGKAKAAMCGACHGADGMSKMPTYPNLKGQKAAYLVKQMKNFKNGTRKDATMNAIVKSLSDADMENLAAFYSGM